MILVQGKTETRKRLRWLCFVVGIFCFCAGAGLIVVRGDLRNISTDPQETLVQKGVMRFMPKQEKDEYRHELLLLLIVFLASFTSWFFLVPGKCAGAQSE